MPYEYRVNVCENEGSEKVIARVRYNSALDYWDGSNHQNGGVGRHLGITKLRDGRYVLIHGTQWEGEKDVAYVVSPEEALQAILKSDNGELLDTKKFRELKDLYEDTMAEEEKDLVEEDEI